MHLWAGTCVGEGCNAVCIALSAACSRRRNKSRSVHLQVSRVKRLPIPAESTQLLGKEFVGEDGRGANLIDIFGGAVEVRGSPENFVWGEGQEFVGREALMRCPCLEHMAM